MDLHLFDLNLLVALDALLTERNVTRAGNRLNLSQSAMSGGSSPARGANHFILNVPQNDSPKTSIVHVDFRKPISCWLTISGCSS